MKRGMISEVLALEFFRSLWFPALNRREGRLADRYGLGTETRWNRIAYFAVKHIEKIHHCIGPAVAADDFAGLFVKGHRFLAPSMQLPLP